MASQSHPPHLLLHNLITSVSYWGTSVRILLIGFVLLIATLLGVLDGDSSVSLLTHSAQYIYIMGSLLLLDAGYVTIARALPVLSPLVDRLLLLFFMSMLGLTAVLPYFASVPATLVASLKWVFLVTLFILALRLVVGLFFGSRPQK